MIKGTGGPRRALSLLFSAILSLQLLGIDAPRALADSIEAPTEEEILTAQAGFEEVGDWQELENAFKEEGHPEIMLKNDITYGDGYDGETELSPYLEVSEGREITLDLAGHTINRNMSGIYTGETQKPSIIKNNGTLTIIDRSEGQTGSITGGKSTYGYGAIYNSGTLTIEGGTIHKNATSDINGAGAIYNDGTLIIEGGTIRDNIGGVSGAGAIYNEGTLVIKGGKFIDNSAQSYGAIVHNGLGFELSGNPSFERNTYGNDEDVEDVYIIGASGHKITLTGPLDKNVQIAVGSNNKSQSSDMITYRLSNNGSISNFVSSRPDQRVALGRWTEEVFLGTPHDINCDTTTNGQVTADKNKALNGEAVTLHAEPDPGFELESYVVKSDDGSDVPIDAYDTFTMPESAVTVSATFKAAKGINFSWYRSEPTIGWDRVEGVSPDEQHEAGHYEAQALRIVDGIPSPVGNWVQKSYYDPRFDLQEIIASNGPGTYAVGVKAYDGEDNIIATGQSSPKTFHRLDFTLETRDANGAVIDDLNGGSIWLEYSDDSGESVNYWSNNNWSSNKSMFRSDDCEITVSMRTEDGFAADKLYVDDTEVSDGHQFTMGGDHNIKAVFRQDLNRVPATITLDDGHEQLAQKITTALNENDPNYSAKVDDDNDDVVSFTVLKAQSRNSAINKLQDVLSSVGIERWSNECLLTLSKDYSTYQEWQEGMGYSGTTSTPMPDELNLFLIWTQTVPEVNVTVESPVCGTEVSMTSSENGGSSQTNGPIVNIIDDTAVCMGARWVEPSDSPYYSPVFVGTIEGGTEYTASIGLDEKFGYVFDESTQITINGKAASLPKNGGNMVQTRVTAVHDWDDNDKACKACHIERVDINFKTSEGGTGSMDPVYVGKDESYTLPKCGFTAPAGKDFAYWLVQVANGEAKFMEIGETIVATDNVNVTAVYGDPATEPEFKTYNVTLTGQIGLNVFLNLPEVEGANYDDSYVEFTVDGNRRGRTVKVSRDPNFRDVNTGTYYGFTLPLSSIEMAQNVTATFHYSLNGEDKAITKEGITVENYINAWIARGITGTDLGLAQALADYGYHVQQFLSQTNNWSLGSDYTAVTTVFTRDYNKDDVLQQLAQYPQYQLRKQLYSSDVTKVTATLSLDSETTLDLMLTTNENAEFERLELGKYASGMIQFGAYEPELVGSRYRIRVDGIRAQNLDKPISVYGQTKNEADKPYFEINATPLGYAYAVLNSEAFALNHGHEAMCALYNYYKAVTDYIAAH